MCVCVCVYIGKWFCILDSRKVGAFDPRFGCGCGFVFGFGGLILVSVSLFNFCGPFAFLWITLPKCHFASVQVNWLFYLFFFCLFVLLLFHSIHSLTHSPIYPIPIPIRKYISVHCACLFMYKCARSSCLLSFQKFHF